MKYVSLFSGIEAATVAWEPLGWEPLAFAEVEPFCCSVLAQRFPEVPNLGDVTKIDYGKEFGKHGRIDLVVGGSPCQSFSVAGKRTGLDGASGLMWEYVRAIRELMPRWVVWENVPGALSSTHGEDFGCLLRSLDDLRYGLSWRVLDAQFFGVPQRRRRVFLVGCLGDVERACQVLFEPESLRWDTPSSAEKRKALAAGSGSGAAGEVLGISGNIIGRKPENGGYHLGVCDQDEGGFYTLTATDRHAVAFAANQRGEVRLQGGDGDVFGAIPSSWSAKQVQGVLCMTETQPNTLVGEEECGTLTARMHKDPPVVAGGGIVLRRLMPVECERLQGFPDNWTDVEHNGKPATDTARYRAIGNSMAVSVMRWIGERIELSERGEL